MNLFQSANVFLYKDGSAKLGDLNVSKVARRGLGYTQTGTPYYASPEIWKVIQIILFKKFKIKYDENIGSTLRQ